MEDKTQVFIDVWMDKCGIYINGILFSLKKWSSDTCYNMDETWGYFSKWNKLVTKGQMFYDSIYMKCLE